jgi:hypothetical protein
MKIQDRASLERRRLIIEADLQAKLEVRDYHGVCDAAMDLREIDAQVSLLASLNHQPVVEMDPPHPGIPDLEI